MDIRGPKRHIINLIALTKSQPHIPLTSLIHRRRKISSEMHELTTVHFVFLSDTLDDLCTCHFRPLTSHSFSSLSGSSHNWKGKTKELNTQLRKRVQKFNLEPNTDAVSYSLHLVIHHLKRATLVFHHVSISSLIL